MRRPFTRYFVTGTKDGDTYYFNGYGSKEKTEPYPTDKYAYGRLTGDFALDKVYDHIKEYMEGRGYSDITKVKVTWDSYITAEV
jgi:hypothetical protein